MAAEITVIKLFDAHGRQIAEIPLSRPEIEAYNLGLKFCQLGKLSQAITAFKEAITLQPHFVDAHYNLGVILTTTGRLEQAKILFDQALEFDLDFALTHRNLAAYYQRISDFEKMDEHYQRALDLDEQVFEREPGPPRRPPKIDH